MQYSYQTCVNRAPSPQFHFLSLYEQTFCVTSHFEKRTPNDHNMALNHIRLKVFYICLNSVHESQISVRFTLWPEDVILRQRKLRWKGRMFRKIESAPNDLKTTLKHRGS